MPICLSTIPDGFSRARATEAENTHERPLLLVIRLRPWAKDVACVQIPAPFSDVF